MEKSELAEKITRDWPARGEIATTAELGRVGLSPRLLASAVRHSLLFRIRHGAYVRMGVWQEKYPSEKVMLRVTAHFHATHGRALYSHASAARLLGLSLWNVGPGVHITTPSSVSAKSTVPGVKVHRRQLPDSAQTRISHHTLGPVRTTTLEQTIVDCARTEPFVTAVIIGDSGLHRGASLAVMLELLDAIRGRRGVRAARKVLAALDKGSESAGETRLRLMVADMDILQPEYQVHVQAAGNNYRVDGAWRDIKLALEFDGKTKYFAFRPTDEALYEERQRERELMEDGWSFIRVEWKDLADAELLRRRIMAAMLNARKRLAAVQRDDLW